MPDRTPQVVVIGGGITGLCCAHRLQALGVGTRLLEASDRVGGRIDTVSEGGFEFEAGPNTLLGNSPALIALLDELGLGQSVIEAAPDAKRRYVLYHDRLEPLPMGPIAALTSPLLGIVGIVQAAGDLFRSRPANVPPDESVSSFIQRRFGSRVLENLVTPFLAGIYAGDPDRLEARSVLKQLVAAEEQAGSVIRGMLQARRRNRRSGERKRPARSITFRGGLAALSQRLAMELGPRIRTHARVVAVERDEGACLVRLAGGETIACGRVVVASETGIAAGLVEELPGGGPIAADLRAIRSSGVAVVGLAYPRSAVAHPLDGFGFLAGPGSEGPVLGCLFRSTIFPHTAPEGMALLVCFLGGARHDLSGVSDAAVVELARAELAARVGASGHPARVFFRRWAEAIPQSVQGHAQRVRRIVSWSCDSRVSIVSSGVFGAPLPLCIAAGRAEAERLAPLVASAPRRQQEMLACR
jgi:oxygen-dependent protoporphyrinogen oxidase